MRDSFRVLSLMLSIALLALLIGVASVNIEWLVEAIDRFYDALSTLSRKE